MPGQANGVLCGRRGRRGRRPADLLDTWCMAHAHSAWLRQGQSRGTAPRRAGRRRGGRVASSSSPRPVGRNSWLVLGIRVVLSAQKRMKTRLLSICSLMGDLHDCPGPWLQTSIESYAKLWRLDVDDARAPAGRRPCDLVADADVDAVRWLWLSRGGAGSSAPPWLAGEGRGGSGGGPGRGRGPPGAPDLCREPGSSRIASPPVRTLDA